MSIFERERTSAKMILYALYLYFLRLSFRNTSKTIQPFGEKINVSNSNRSDSTDADISADGTDVMVTWWERNQTAEEPVMRISNNNGATFGPILTLASNGTIGEPEEEG